MTSETTEKFDAKQMLKEVARLLNRAKVPLSEDYREQYKEAMSDVTADLNLLIGSINELKQLEDEIETLEYKKAKKIQEIRKDLKDSESTYPQIYSMLRGETEHDNQQGLLDEQERIKRSIENLLEENLCKYLYDYTWIMEAMNQTEGMPHFDTPNSFINYLKGLGIEKLPSDDSISKKQNSFSGNFPNWDFNDCDTTEATRRINIGKFFLSAFRKKQHTFS